MKLQRHDVVALVIQSLVILGVTAYEVYLCVQSFQNPANALSTAQQNGIPFPLLRFCGFDPHYKPNISRCTLNLLSTGESQPCETTDTITYRQNIPGACTDINFHGTLVSEDHYLALEIVNVGQPILMWAVEQKSCAKLVSLSSDMCFSRPGAVAGVSALGGYVSIDVQKTVPLVSDPYYDYFPHANPPGTDPMDLTLTVTQQVSLSIEQWTTSPFTVLSSLAAFVGLTNQIRRMLLARFKSKVAPVATSEPFQKTDAKTKESRIEVRTDPVEDYEV